MSSLFCVMRPSRLLTAEPTSLTCFPPTVYEGAVTPPFASTPAPPPSAAATLVDEWNSCEPLTASRLALLTAPYATPVKTRAPCRPAQPETLPPVVAPGRRARRAAAGRTNPAVPSLNALIDEFRLAISAVFCTTFCVTEYNCEPFTASTLSADTSPALTFVSATGAALASPSVILSWLLES